MSRRGSSGGVGGVVASNVLDNSIYGGGTRSVASAIENMQDAINSLDDATTVLAGLPNMRVWNEYHARGQCASTTVSTLGVPGTFAGTATARTPSSAGLWHEAQVRIGYVSAAGAGSGSGYRDTTAWTLRGDATTKGGFLHVIRFALSTVVSDEQCFAGIMQAGVPSVGDPSTTLNSFVGMGADGADTTMQIMHSDNIGPATKINLGASFPAKTAGASYELILFGLPNGTAVDYAVRRLDASSGTVSGTISSDLPASTLLLTRQIYAINNATASAVAIELISFASAVQR